MIKFEPYGIEGRWVDNTEFIRLEIRERASTLAIKACSRFVDDLVGCAPSRSGDHSSMVDLGQSAILHYYVSQIWKN